MIINSFSSSSAVKASQNLTNSLIAVSLVSPKNVSASNDLSNVNSAKNSNSKISTDGSEIHNNSCDNEKKGLHISTSLSVSSSSNFSSQSTSPSSSFTYYIQANQFNTDLPLTTTTRLNSEICLINTSIKNLNNENTLNDKKSSAFNNNNLSFLYAPDAVNSINTFKSSLRARKVTLDFNINKSYFYLLYKTHRNIFSLNVMINNY